MHTVNAAMERGIDVMAVPGPVGEPSSLGTQPAAGRWRDAGARNRRRAVAPRLDRFAARPLPRRSVVVRGYPPTPRACCRSSTSWPRRPNGLSARPGCPPVRSPSRCEELKRRRPCRRRRWLVEPPRPTLTLPVRSAAALRSHSPLPLRPSGAPRGARSWELPCAASLRCWRSQLRSPSSPGSRPRPPPRPSPIVEPVAGTVTDPFRPPATPYGRGNRGLAYATENGSSARASAPGRVTFAGQVGGALHVVVQHADGVRTSYSFLRSVAVRTGTRVDAGDVVGTTASTFHFGARIGDAYIDPAILLASGPARVHLIPDAEFSEVGASDDRKALARRRSPITSARWPSSAVEWAKGTRRGCEPRWWRSTSSPCSTRSSTSASSPDRSRRCRPRSPTSSKHSSNRARPPDVAPPPRTERRIAVFVAGLGSHSSGAASPANLSQRLDASTARLRPGRRRRLLVSRRPPSCRIRVR